MTFRMRPEESVPLTVRHLRSAAAGLSASFPTHLDSTDKSGNAVQVTGATSEPLSISPQESEANDWPNRYAGQFALNFAISLTLRRRSVASTVALPTRQGHLSRQSESAAS